VNESTPKKVVFLTGTRADFGKIKSLLRSLNNSGSFSISLFVTGMHMLSRYGYTFEEVRSLSIGEIYTFINQNEGDSMESTFAKTVSGFSDFVQEVKPDLVVVHGDRIETLAGATVGALAGILVAHIEGGEVSGTIDELIRHAVTKLAHVHFVSNEAAMRRVQQLGEDASSIYTIGSPDIDVMDSQDLPDLFRVKEYYDITFDDYAVALYHPVTTESSQLLHDVKVLVDYMISSNKNFVVIHPNNDPGSNIIVQEFERLRDNPRFRIFPSMRFEYFLTALKNSQFIIGNSSAGVREAPHFGVPAVNLGTRQYRRASSPLVLNSDLDEGNIAQTVEAALSMVRTPDSHFGDGNSAQLFAEILQRHEIWDIPIQKSFVDR
jgi:UDP-N-acetylglucosamine 2-epimerase (hydrolysing)